MFMRYYVAGLPFALVPSMFASGLCGVSELMESRDIIYPHHKIFNFMGVLSIGVAIGFTYPISTPLLAGRYLYRNRVM
jgi:hypothetical protein